MNLCEGEEMTHEMKEQGTEDIRRGDHLISFVLQLYCTETNGE